MEMRAREDIDMGEDIIPPIPPLAFSLHDSFLSSHCSACFRFLTNDHNNTGLLRSSPSLPILPANPSILSSSVLYCSQQCSATDSDSHVSSGEYHFLHLLQSEPTTWTGDTSDLRTSLRLLLCFERLGFLSHHQNQDHRLHGIPSRIAGLISNRDRVEGGDPQSDEMFAKIREGVRLMSLARRTRDHPPSTPTSTARGHEHEHELEKFVLCQVLMNSVEVQIKEGRSLGVAVYGPSFSWINHSCSPNACYRFVPTGSEMQCCGESAFRIVASGDEVLLKKWVCEESKFSQGWCGYGPRCVVRSIKPIKKGEEVFVTYTDLLQPKAIRHAELWLRYRFICNCRRCSASPEAYVDSILQDNAAINRGATNSISENGFCSDEAYEDLSDFMDEAITEYLLDGDPKSLCEKLESMLIRSLQNGQLQPKGEPLHPLHYLCLNAYISLTSAYKVQASHFLDLHSETGDHQLEAFNMSRTGAAYCLLLAGVTHHLFLSETSLIVPAANIWIDAGESLLGLCRSSRWSLINEQSLPHSDILCSLCSRYSRCKLMDKLETISACPLSPSISTQAEFEEVSGWFLDCVSMFSPRVWPFLIHGHHFLGYFSDPIDFKWLGMPRASTFGDYRPRFGVTDVNLDYGDERSCGVSRSEWGCTDGERSVLFRFGAHCLLYGGYLSSICYGSHGPLTQYARNVLRGGNVTR